MEQAQGAALKAVKACESLKALPILWDFCRRKPSAKAIHIIPSEYSSHFFAKLCSVLNAENHEAIA